MTETIISGIIVASTAVAMASATFMMAVITWDDYKEHKAKRESKDKQ